MIFYIIFIYIITTLSFFINNSLFFINEEFLIFISFILFFIYFIYLIRKSFVLFIFFEIKSIYIYFKFLFSIN